MVEEKTNLAPPWITYARKLYKLFEADPEVRVEYVDEDKTVKLYVESQEKADALSKILPDNPLAAWDELKIVVIPANKEEESPFKTFEKAFKGNPIVSYTETIPAYGQEMNFVVFKPEVVQYYNDNIGDINGVESTLYQDIAKEVFADLNGILFCTDIEDQAFLGKPLGEWP